MIPATTANRPSFAPSRSGANNSAMARMKINSPHRIVRPADLDCVAKAAMGYADAWATCGGRGRAATRTLTSGAACSPELSQ
jgi:hypothetical protein